MILAEELLGHHLSCIAALFENWSSSHRSMQPSIICADGCLAGWCAWKFLQMGCVCLNMVSLQDDNPMMCTSMFSRVGMCLHLFRLLQLWLCKCLVIRVKITIPRWVWNPNKVLLQFYYYACCIQTIRRFYGYFSHIFSDSYQFFPDSYRILPTWTFFSRRKMSDFSRHISRVLPPTRNFGVGRVGTAVSCLGVSPPPSVSAEIYRQTPSFTDRHRILPTELPNYADSFGILPTDTEFYRQNYLI